MEWLNYHHLLYYWMVVRTGSVAAASEALKLASPTISVQIRRLEEQLGEKLLRRSGRHVVPTEMGQIVYRYADEIFALGRELLDTARGRPTGRPMHVVIGVHDVIPKSIARWLIEPALKLPDPVRITCREGSSEQLLAELSIQRVDVVLADAPISPTVKVRAYNHLLGETGLSFLGVPRLVRKYRPGFPKSLNDAPMLLPTPNTAVRRTLDQWFDESQFESYRFLGSALTEAVLMIARAGYLLCVTDVNTPHVLSPSSGANAHSATLRLCVNPGELNQTAAGRSGRRRP